MCFGMGIMFANFHVCEMMLLLHISTLLPFNYQFLLLSAHSHDHCYWVESDLPACGPPARSSVHLASSGVTPAEFVHKSRGDNVERMWVKLKR